MSCKFVDLVGACRNGPIVSSFLEDKIDCISDHGYDGNKKSNEPDDCKFANYDKNNPKYRRRRNLVLGHQADNKHDASTSLKPIMCELS